MLEGVLAFVVPATIALFKWTSISC